MKIKKSELLESKFIVRPDEYKKIKDEIEDDDTVHVIDEDEEDITEEEECEDEEIIDENVKSIISKNELIKFLKENKG